MALKIEKIDPEGFDKNRVTSLVLREDEAPDYVSDAIATLISNWKLVALITFVVVAITFAVTKLMLTKWYRATAIIEPITEGGVEDRMQGGMGSVSGSDVAALMGLGGSSDQQAQEYMTILQSFAFNTAVARDHNLVDHILSHQSLLASLLARPRTTRRQVDMDVYESMEDLFSVEYSIQAGNLSLHFLDEDPLVAEKILNHYVNDLRQLLRQEAIRSSSAALESLEKEAKTTPDPMMAQNLYALIAKQIQRQKLAEVSADFAFKILEPPVSSDRPFTPRARVNCFLAMVLTPVVVLVFLMLFGSRRSESSGSTARKHSAQFADLA